MKDSGLLNDSSVCSLFGSCLLLAASAAGGAEPALKDVFKDSFTVGAALSTNQFSGGNDCSIAVIERHFNTITSENILKWELVHPQPDKFEFAPADAYVAFGERHRMFIVGHTLIWHQQIPRWVFRNEKDQPLSREALLERMRQHIQTVVGRYKGRIAGWDVVNEALNDDGTLRRTQWLSIIGEDYLLKAFQFAHEADPKAELYYNDYALEKPAKRKGAVELLTRLRSQGARIAGVGLQGHYKLDTPTAAVVDETIQTFSKAGFKVMITELDVDVLPPASRPLSADVSERTASRPELNPYTNGLPDVVQKKLAQRYGELFGVFQKHRQHVERVTFWGVTDKQSWLNYWPVRGRMNYPLLFDRNCQPKPALESVIRVAGDAMP